MQVEYTHAGVCILLYQVTLQIIDTLDFVILLHAYNYFLMSHRSHTLYSLDSSPLENSREGWSDKKIT